ncbi:hypothetical protein EBI01_19755 [Marinomonas rhizomae]|uniref:Uncharacterized protein n=1 Tax=Marinomonas rhizomae TaxID=491948 RepID=A0A366IT04_9GAMM|nr:hypothetical protein [Marinomonas rhizomae]RBP77912.1 hypothetical protein DFP80_1243 [Marinomonas rhizomae]RNF68891.1 hypothetical protein EBI01_19755 [Marinomonas rhizomae]
MRIFLSIFGTLIFLASAKFGYCLLIEDKLNGAEFVSLIIAFAIIGLILSFASEIQEFSIAGNIVKLKEVKRDAEKSISELKSARIETFRFLLSLAKRHPGGFSDSGTVDGRVNDFWSLHDQIVAFNCEDELARNLLEVVGVLLQGQLSSISHSSDAVRSKYHGKNKTPKPSQLTIEALDNDSVELAAKRKVAGGDQAKIKEMLVVGLEEYKKLYELRGKYQNKM